MYGTDDVRYIQARQDWEDHERDRANALLVARPYAAALPSQSPLSPRGLDPVGPVAVM